MEYLISFLLGVTYMMFIESLVNDEITLIQWLISVLFMILFYTWGARQKYRKLND